MICCYRRGRVSSVRENPKGLQAKSSPECSEPEVGKQVSKFGPMKAGNRLEETTRMRMRSNRLIPNKVLESAGMVFLTSLLTIR
jgi:hypothetical protein